MKKFEYSITGNDVVPQNMIGDIFLGHSVYIISLFIILVQTANIYDGEHIYIYIYIYINQSINQGCLRKIIKSKICDPSASWAYVGWHGIR